jgi:hypothetical protein
VENGVYFFLEVVKGVLRLPSVKEKRGTSSGGEWRVPYFFLPEVKGVVIRERGIYSFR